MEKLTPSQGFFSIGLLVSVAYLAAAADTSLILERPTSSWVTILLACAAALLLPEKIRLRRSQQRQRDEESAAIPLEDPRDTLSTEDLAKSEPRSEQNFWLRCGGLALVLVLRIELFRRSGATSLDATIPVFVVVADSWRRLHDHRHDHSRTNELRITRSLLKHACNPIVYIAVLVYFGFLAISYTTSTLPSSYISYPHHVEASAPPSLVAFGVGLDGLIAIYAYISLDPIASGQSQGKSGTASYLGTSFLVAASLRLVLGLLNYLWTPSHPANKVVDESRGYFPHLLKLALITGFTAFFALRSIHRNGFLDTTLFILCTVSYISLIIHFWDPTSFLHGFKANTRIPLGLLLGVILRSAADFWRERPLDVHRKPGSWSIFHLFGILFAIQVVLVHWGSPKLHHHQVDLLMHAAKQRHGSWLKVASSSTSIAEATANYIARYNRNPPPNFDQWYKYAISQSAKVIDEFDAIYDDLLPFWSLPPTELRRRTKEALLTPTPGIGAVSIRNGIAKVAGNTPGTHKWQLYGVVEMINHFSEYLPDMDLAFNLNDESRVSLPYDERKKALKAAKSELGKWNRASTISKGFSNNRADGWSVNPDEELDYHHFDILSFQNTWAFGSAHCPPDSPARAGRRLDPEAFCASCASPHSLDLFMSNWTLAADVCHQPDLAHLHGFYLSPSAFDATAYLMPIFSQSKAGGFNDIRYPSPFNYIDKVKYEPTEEYPDNPFEMKRNIVFWRGGTSDGFSKTGTRAWKGMARQRMVNLVAKTPSAQALLLPDEHRSPSGDQLFRYDFFDPSNLHQSIDTDVRFSQVFRCDASECAEQESFFGLAPQTDFQEHWRYKYLLDVDGAGYSGRFIPFMQSKSLPFKMALFREWYDSRLFPWLHFVPLDLRGQGLWATLAYFAGFSGYVGRMYLFWTPRDYQAKTIAEDGAKWAQEVLRKEDMEIYMFRLLLEWGRLTDDSRSEIGFVLE